MAGLALTAGGIILHQRRRLRLHVNATDAVPQPRQIVAADGRILYTNRACRKVFDGGRRPIPDLLAEQTRDDEEARRQLERLAANARNGVAGSAELRVRVASPGEADAAGSVEWRYAAAYPIPDSGGAVYWLVDDITLRRQMQQVIEEEQARFVDLLEHAPIGFYSVDETGRFLFANRTLCEWLDLTLDQLVGGMRLHDVLARPPGAGGVPHSPFEKADASAGEVALKNGRGGSFNAAINQDVVVDEDGEHLRTRSMVRDLSRERAMLEALEEYEQRFRRFFQEAPVGIVLLEPSGRVIEANRAFARLVGRDESVAGLSLLDMVDPEDRPAVAALLGAEDPPSDQLGGVPPLEIRLSGGAPTICALYLTRLEGGGQGAGVIAHFIDTTEQKNLEVQFAQSQKMQAVGQLAGGIAHDFNNLLTAMIGFCDLLLLRHRPGDQSFADIMQIKQNANRAANLVRQLLAFSRQQTLQPRVLNITDILAELSHLLRRLIGENIQLELIHGRDLGVVKADQGQLEQVIINLAVNARDAMPEGGSLRLRTSAVTLERPEKRGGEVIPAGDYVLLEVEDSGCGIEPDNLGRIFDPFFSTKEVGAGTGLGLSTVYGIVKQTDGFVFVDSEIGRGTRFSIYLPCESGPEEAVGQLEGEVQASRDLTGVGRLLLVEDEEAVRAFSARALRNKGYEVLEADSGESALALLNESDRMIDLLITDVVMPKVDGPTLVKEVRERWSDLKVIFMSGYAEDSFRKRLDQEADIHFLPKPFSLKQLAGKVKEVLES